MKSFTGGSKGLFIVLLFAVLLVAVYFVGNHFYVKQVKNNIYENLEEQEGFRKENLNIGDISGNFITQSVIVKNVSYEYPIVKGYKIVNTLDKVILKNFKQEGDIVTSANIEVTGISISSVSDKNIMSFEARMVEPFVEYLKRYKYNFAIEENYSTESNNLVIDNSQLTVYPKSNPQAYTNLSLGFGAKNITPEMLKNSKVRNNPGSAKKIVLDYLRFKIQDKGKNIKKIISKSKKYDQYKQKLLAQLNRIKSQINKPQLAETKEKIFLKLVTFVKNDFESLSMSIDFQGDVTVADILRGEISDEKIKIGNY